MYYTCVKLKARLGTEKGYRYREKKGRETLACAITLKFKFKPLRRCLDTCTCGFSARNLQGLPIVDSFMSGTSLERETWAHEELNPFPCLFSPQSSSFFSFLSSHLTSVTRLSQFSVGTWGTVIFSRVCFISHTQSRVDPGMPRGRRFFLQATRGIPHTVSPHRGDQQGFTTAKVLTLSPRPLFVVIKSLFQLGVLATKRILPNLK